LLIRVRDEAHRFAVTFHRKRRSARTLHSELDDIPGVGQQRKVLLLKSFGSVQGIRGASVTELASVPGIGLKFAERILEGLKEGATNDAA
ncbi:MAG: excinuclease ABC subunit C, partial [Candidatus Eisenbacteria bacterium]|nr:excinuclease ABC subunit C [Candidatus Eisenbacteria bacterium]